MYTTIEPHLIALLNTSNDVSSEAYVPSTSLALPPLQDPNVKKASVRPLLLESDAGKRNEQLQHTPLIAPNEDDGTLQQESDKQHRAGNSLTGGGALGVSSPQSLRKILHVEDQPAIVLSKKRHIQEKDEFVQLPPPPKKQKAAKQVVPPIIIGLFEPPPQATLFPPIASSSFHDSHGRNTLNTIPHIHTEVDTREPIAKDCVRRKTIVQTKDKKDVRARKKWTEEETKSLLLGVHKHGVGNWGDIVDDPLYSFNGRSGADLKDRFRTCCPTELWEKGSTSGIPKRSHTRTRAMSSLMSENILTHGEEASGNSAAEKSNGKPRKSRAHRKKMEDLAQLGIDTFQKSLRRERRPFSEDEDNEILEGYRLHGSAWTRIQRDPRFHLQDRKPTDLRDRFRNKFPEKFRLGEKSKEAPANETSQSSVTRDFDRSVPGMEYPYAHPQDGDYRTKNVNTNDNFISDTRCSLNSLQPSSSREGLRIQEIISAQSPTRDSSSFQNQSPLFQTREGFTFPEQSSLESADGTSFTQSTFDWGGSIAAPYVGSMGEMDISRLLLEPWDEPSSSGMKEKPSFTDVNTTITSSTDSNHQSFYHLLNGDSEQLGDLHNTAFN